MVLLNVCLLTNRNETTYREVTVSVNKTNAMPHTAGHGFLSNVNEIICLSRMLNRSDSTYHISLNFFVIADKLVFTLS